MFPEVSDFRMFWFFDILGEFAYCRIFWFSDMFEEFSDFLVFRDVSGISGFSDVWVSGYLAGIFGGVDFRCFFPGNPAEVNPFRYNLRGMFCEWTPCSVP